MLFTTTAHPTALAAAGTSYSQMAVRIGNNFIELEINNAVEIILPLNNSAQIVIRGSHLWYPRRYRAPHRTERCKPAVSAAHNTRKKRYCTIKGLPPSRSLIGSEFRALNNFARIPSLKYIENAD
jgi:hypothetical protein